MPREPDSAIPAAGPSRPLAPPPRLHCRENGHASPWPPSPQKSAECVPPIVPSIALALPGLPPSSFQPRLSLRTASARGPSPPHPPHSSVHSRSGSEPAAWKRTSIPKQDEPAAACSTASSSANPGPLPVSPPSCPPPRAIRQTRSYPLTHSPAPHPSRSAPDQVESSADAARTARQRRIDHPRAPDGRGCGSEHPPAATRPPTPAPCCPESTPPGRPDAVPVLPPTKPASPQSCRSPSQTHPPSQTVHPHPRPPTAPSAETQEAAPPDCQRPQSPVPHHSTRQTARPQNKTPPLHSPDRHPSAAPPSMP